MASTILAPLLMGLVLLVVAAYVLRGFEWRHVSLRSDPDADPLLARRPETEGPAARPFVARRVVAGALLLALALTAFGITVTSDLGQAAVWGVVGVAFLYAALVFLGTARVRRAGPN